MATKNYYVSREQRHPLYSNKMLTTGVAIPLSDSAAKLYRDLGVKDLSDEAPRRAAKIEAPVAETPDPEPVKAEAPKPAKAPAKKAVRRKKSA